VDGHVAFCWLLVFSEDTKRGWDFGIPPPLQNFVTAKLCQKFVQGSPSIFGGKMFLLISLCGLVISNQHLCQKVLEKNQLITCQAYQNIPSNSGETYVPGSKLPRLGMVILPSIGNPYIINPTSTIGLMTIPYYMEIMGV